ncbi:MAG: cytochrome c3 family protein [Pseudomonadales bacterium]
MKKAALFILALIIIVITIMVYLSSDHHRAAQEIQYQPQLAMTFDHQTHRKQQCVACHHNYIDKSGQGLCLECHVTTEGLRLELEEQFHGLCMGCHEEKQAEGEGHGPIRECLACHTEDKLP